ncbi:glycogen operon protein [Arthrobacter sp. CAN_A212]|uniref:glycogen debranching protein GlgX n=1 Tax=Arthrobacter sp. CAN_A212 TaxID=2787719 RepID=UPI0018C9B2D8
MSVSLELSPPSSEFPLGVHRSRGRSTPADSVNVAVYAPGVSALAVHYQGQDGAWHSTTLADYTHGVHHGVVEGLADSVRYAFWPVETALPDTSQLLLDPYTRAIDTVDTESGPVYWSVYVQDNGFDWGTSAPPRTNWRDTVVYEAHVKGLTRLHPDIPAELRGTYAGLAHPVMIRHLRELGVTAVELLPVHFHIDEPHLGPLGLTNYWGYNTLGYFAPHPGYATEAARAAGPRAVQDEFKGMVKLLHEAGLEVLLDVVYNHTAEGPPDLPALSWRGLAEQQYYRPGDHGRYVDTTGCGNTLNFSHPRVVALALDSLRYWVEEFHIDGFRFDLAVSMARDETNTFTPRHPFLVAAGADRALRGIKLIAEPWDIGMGGWQTGNFPQGWADWNDRFRDTVRDFWLTDQASLAAGGAAGTVARLAGCLSGSTDLFAPSGRTSVASINLITAHDGFTLADLTAYSRKHNENNGEQNRDGHNDNRSYNHGMEGPTDQEAISAARSQTSRNLMATLLLSLGVPMITAGDEFGRSQRGNNNAYCQDNELAWLHWDHDDDARHLLEHTRSLLRIRREFLAHQPHGYPARDDSSYLHWFNPAGTIMSQDQWNDPGSRTVQLLLGSPDGILDGLVVINGSMEDARITLPSRSALEDNGLPTIKRFELRYTTAGDQDRRRGARVGPGETDLVPANSISVYRV